MDKSPKYQKMCIEAFKDIGYIKPTVSSNLMIPAPGSIHNQQADDFMLSFEDEFDNIGLGSTVARPIGQLYQQDQLQEFLRPPSYSNWALAVDFSDFINDNIDPVWEKSMEEMWLIFAMKEKFQKEWKGSKWIHT